MKPKGAGARANDRRGNNEDRRRRRQWLLDTFGDGTTAPCFCCGQPLSLGSLTVDRIVPGAAGGRYTRGNIRPSCWTCNVSAWQPWRRFLSEHDGRPDESLDPDELRAAYAAWA